MSTTSTLNTNVGIASLLGIGLEAIEGQPVQATKLLDRVSGSLDLERTIIARRSLRNNVGITGTVPGMANIQSDITFEPTPEGISALMCAFLGIPSSIANGPYVGASGPGAQIAITFTGGAPTRAAQAYGVIANGAMISVVIVDPGAGYGSAPVASAAGAAAINAVQKITITNATGGTFTVSFGGNTTSALAYNVSAANFQTAFRALASVGAGNATVTLVGSVYTITFTGSLAGASQTAITVDGTSLTGVGHSIAAANVVTGAPATSGTTTFDTVTLLNGAVATVPITASSGYPALISGGNATHTWNDGFGQFTSTLSELRGNAIYCFPGARISSLSVRIQKEQTEPISLAATFMALNQLMYPNLSDLGLDSAGYDTHPALAAVQTTVDIGGLASADCQSVDLKLNKNLGKRMVLDGYMGANSHYMQRSEHQITATLYFADESQLEQFFGQASTVETPYGALENVIFVPITINIVTSVNANGYVNVVSFIFTQACYQRLSAPVRGPEAIMQEIQILPIVDTETNTSLQIAITNGETLPSFSTFGTPVSSVPSNQVTAYQV